MGNWRLSCWCSSYMPASTMRLPMRRLIAPACNETTVTMLLKMGCDTLLLATFCFESLTAQPGVNSRYLHPEASHPNQEMPLCRGVKAVLCLESTCHLKALRCTGGPDNRGGLQPIALDPRR